MKSSPNNMDHRARFLAAMRFGHPDRIPFEPGHPRESTLVAWHAQGLPAEAQWLPYLLDLLDLPEARKKPQPGLDVVFHLLPAFEEKVLSRRDGHTIVQDWMGAVTEISDQYDYTYIRSAKDFVTRKWHRFPVQDRAGWREKIVWRYDPADPARFPADFASRCAQLSDREDVAFLNFNGPFWQMREWLGFENLCTLFADDPVWIGEMVAFWTDYILQLLDRVLAATSLDHVQVNEDMAYKLHSMISPRMARRFLVPAWRQWIAAIKTRSPEAVVTIDSDGYIAELIPLFIEAGFDGTWPVEVAAGNDLNEFRRLYSHDMAYGGGIDKRALAAGGSAMRAELKRILPVVESGGYIPGCDHGVPADISWPDFIAYARELARMTGWL
jgi:hypothetical protein